jgi:hypothetical protein
MRPNRIHEQYRIAVNETDDAILSILIIDEKFIIVLLFLVGSKYERIPEGSTDRYTQWANNLTEEQLYTQVSTAFLMTVSRGVGVGAIFYPYTSTLFSVCVSQKRSSVVR